MSQLSVYQVHVKKPLEYYEGITLRLPKTASGSGLQPVGMLLWEETHFQKGVFLKKLKVVSLLLVSVIVAACSNVKRSEVPSIEESTHERARQSQLGFGFDRVR